MANDAVEAAHSQLISEEIKAALPCSENGDFIAQRYEPYPHPTDWKESNENDGDRYSKTSDQPNVKVCFRYGNG